jgi:hypothetical protein
MQFVSELDFREIHSTSGMEKAGITAVCKKRKCGRSEIFGGAVRS